MIKCNYLLLMSIFNEYTMNDDSQVLYNSNINSLNRAHDNNIQAMIPK